MEALLDTLLDNTAWTWIAGGVLLVALEALMPGAILVWFGIAAVLTGLLVASFGIGFNVQVLFFSVLSIGSVVAFKHWQKRNPPVPAGDDGDALNQPGSHFIGRTLVLATDLRNGSGRVKAADTSWRCTGPDLDAGTSVKVIAVESGRLVVEAAD